MFNQLLAILLCISCLHNVSWARERIAVLIGFNPGDTYDGLLSGNPPSNYWYRLKLACAERGYTLTTARNHDPLDVFAIVSFNNHSTDAPTRFPNAKTILYTWEPPLSGVCNFSPDNLKKYDLVMTWDDSLLDGQKYRKFNYALGFSFPNSLIPFDQKKMCCMFVGNQFSSNPNELYSKRREMIDFLEATAPENFDFYGPGWPTSHICYRGYAQEKVDVMKQYRFAIAYENTRNISGYISEKIFDVFSSGCVPVYWGASNVTQWIPSNTFIDREAFSTDAELYAFLESMPEDVYNGYLANIRTFLSSEQAYLFSQEYFLKQFVDLLESCDLRECNP